MYGEVPTKKEVSKLVIKNPQYLIYSIATQECMRSIFFSFFFWNKSQWIKLLRFIFNFILKAKF